MPNKLINRNLRPQDEGESVWNLFVQILLPLIMILTFMSATLILKYKNQADQVEDDLMDCAATMEELATNFDPDRTLKGQKKYIIKFQKQKLLWALKEVEMNQRKTLQLDRYSLPQNIHMDGIQLKDDLFKAFCANFKKTVLDRNFEIKHAYLKNLYRRVLQKANVVDNSRTPIRFAALNSSTAQSNAQDLMGATESRMTRDNRLFIASEIVKLANSFQQEMISIQTEVVLRIIEAMINNPGDLDDEMKILIKTFMNSTGEKRNKTMAEFYSRMMKTVVADLKPYNILPTVVSEIKSM